MKALQEAVKEKNINFMAKNSGEVRLLQGMRGQILHWQYFQQQSLYNMY